jgi:hypothetical protein
MLFTVCFSNLFVFILYDLALQLQWSYSILLGVSLLCCPMWYAHPFARKTPPPFLGDLHIFLINRLGGTFVLCQPLDLWVIWIVWPYWLCFIQHQQNQEEHEPLSSAFEGSSPASAVVAVDTNLDTSTPDTYRAPPAPLPYDVGLPENSGKVFISVEDLWLQVTSNGVSL